MQQAILAFDTALAVHKTGLRIDTGQVWEVWDASQGLVPDLADRQVAQQRMDNPLLTVHTELVAAPNLCELFDMLPIVLYFGEKGDIELVRLMLADRIGYVRHPNGSRWRRGDMQPVEWYLFERYTHDVVEALGRLLLTLATHDTFTDQEGRSLLAQQAVSALPDPADAPTSCL